MNSTVQTATRPRIAWLAGLNGIVIAASVFLSPAWIALSIGGVALLLAALLSDLGFVIVTTLVSHVSDDMGTSFNLIRGIKWGLMAFVLIVTAWQFALRRDWSGIRFGTIEKYFAVFFLWGIICLFFADNATASVIEFLRLLALYLIYLVTKATVRDRRSVIAVLSLITIVVLSSSIYSLMALAQGHYFRIRGFMNNSGEFATFMSMIVPFVVAAAVMVRRSKLLRAFLVLVAILGAIVILLSWSRGPIIGLIIQALVMLIVHKRRRILAGLGVFAVAGLIALLLIPSVYDIFYKVGRLQAGTTHRTTLWKTGLETIADNPVFGQGFQLRVSDVLHRVYWNDLSTAMLYHDGNGRFHPHNQYLKAAIETGLPGLAIFLALLYFLIRSGVRDFRAEQEPRRAVFFSAALGIFVSFVFLSMFASAPLFGSGSYANYFWIVLGLVHAIRDRNIEL